MKYIIIILISMTTLFSQDHKEVIGDKNLYWVLLFQNNGDKCFVEVSNIKEISLGYRTYIKSNQGTGTIFFQQSTNKLESMALSGMKEVPTTSGWHAPTFTDKLVYNYTIKYLKSKSITYSPLLFVEKPGDYFYSLEHNWVPVPKTELEVELNTAARNDSLYTWAFRYKNDARTIFARAELNGGFVFGKMETDTGEVNTKWTRLEEDSVNMRALKYIHQQLKLSNVNNLKISAENGNPKAQQELGQMYFRGTDLPQDYKLALLWFKKSADQNFAEAQDNLGWMYEYGLGTEIDIKMAELYYNKASLQGNENAKNNLERISHAVPSPK